MGERPVRVVVCRGSGHDGPAAGLGGREVTLEDVYKATDMCDAAAKAGKSDPKTHWLGVRE